MAPAKSLQPAPKIRSGSLMGLASLIEELDGDVDKLLSSAKISTMKLADPNYMIAIAAVVKVLNNCVTQTGCLDFGLRLAKKQNISILGILGKMMLQKSTLKEAFNVAQRYMALHNQAEHWRVKQIESNIVICRYDHFIDNRNPVQYHEMAVGACFQLIKSITGSRVKPKYIGFTHEPVSPQKTYRAYFGTGVGFNQEQDFLIYDANVLHQKVVSLDEIYHSRMDQQIKKLLSRYHDNLALQIRTLILQTMGDQQHDIDNIAQLMGVHKRTLQRRLKEEHISYKGLLHDVRLQQARWHLQYSTIDITLLSEMLGYSDPSAFSKAFRNHVGCSPSQWREANRKALA